MWGESASRLAGAPPWRGTLEGVDSLLDSLSRSAEPGQIAGSLHLPGREARFGEWPDWVPGKLKQVLADRGIARPWIHQTVAANLIHGSVHTVVATGTGSGKSLTAWIPMIAEMLEARAEGTLTTVARTPREYSAREAFGLRPTCLYLAPTKALVADQLSTLQEILHAVDPSLSAVTVDGDAEPAARSFARDYADFVLSNPDFIHHALLPSHPRWTRVLRGLRLIVIDEFHSYRGMFGAHVAHVARRLLRIARHYGARPTVVFLSATVAQPARAAERFLGEAFGPISIVEKDGSPAAAKDVLLWRCRTVERGTDEPQALEGPAPNEGASDSDEGIAAPGKGETSLSKEPKRKPLAELPRRSANLEAGEITARIVAAGGRELTFVRSRPGTERVAEIAREYLHELAPDLAGCVAAYRGGYLPEERRALEAQLRSGTLRGLATTSALELGIDISGLDAVVLCGWPGTHASFFQQLGRAGRGGHDGLGIFIGRDNPLDQYLLSHPDAITASSHEANVFDPLNPNVLLPQLCAAAAELALTASDARIFGLSSTALFADLTAQGLLKKRPNGWFWNTSTGVSAHDVVDLRGGGTTVSIIEKNTGSLLGTVDSSRADTTVFPGAIYIHQGVPFEVEALSDEVALVKRRDVDELRTYPRQESRVEIIRTLEERQTEIGVWARGEVLVSSRVVGYDVRRARDGMYLGFVPLSMPLRELRTAGTWWTISREAIEEAGVLPADLPGGLHGAEHASIAMLPLFATCDRWDLGGLSTEYHSDTGRATVIVHDAIPGGSGCAARGFEANLEWIEATLDLVRSCPCESGCPRCIQSPKCGNNNEPLSKPGAIALLSRLEEALWSSKDILRSNSAGQTGGGAPLTPDF